VTRPTIRLKAVTFNAYHGYPLCPHIEKRLELLERGIVAETPDVILLQEMSASPLYGHLPERLQNDLRAMGLGYSMVYEAANGSAADGGAFEEGSAIFSRWPIVAAEARRLAARHAVRREYHGYEYEEIRIALRATLDVGPAVRLDVFGAHLTDAPLAGGVSPRRLQIEDLATFVSERPSIATPAIVGGDFNATLEEEEIGWLLSRGFRDLCDGFDLGPTNDSHDRDLEDPIDTANQRIDHLFVAGALRQAHGAREEVRVISARRFLDSAFEVEPGRFVWPSDHSGVLVELEL